MASSKVNTQHQISIPQNVRKQLRIKSGDELLVDIQNGMIILLPVHQSYTQSLAGLHHEIWREADESIARERNLWADLSNQQQMVDL